MWSAQTSRVRSSFCRALMIFRPWKNQIRAFRKYWKLYGGWAALATSPFFQASITLGFIVPYFAHIKIDLAPYAISIVPNLLGFSVGSMAILLAFSSSTIFTLIAEEGAENSLFLNMVANFVHFIVVQAICLCLALVSSFVTKFVPLRFSVNVMLFYAIFTAVSTGMQLFNVAHIYNASEEKGDPPSKLPEGEPLDSVK
jgi:hypothetical protein